MKKEVQVSYLESPECVCKQPDKCSVPNICVMSRW